MEYFIVIGILSFISVGLYMVNDVISAWAWDKATAEWEKANPKESPKVQQIFVELKEKYAEEDLKKIAA